MTRNASCPICSTPARKGHIRPIFVDIDPDSKEDLDGELVDRYLAEKEKRSSLETEVANLKSRLSLLELSLASGPASTGTASQNTAAALHTIHINTTVVPFVPGDCLLEFEHMNNVLLVAGLVNSEPFLYKYFFDTPDRSELKGQDRKITAIKVSPFNDGLCMSSSGNCVFISSIYNDKTIYSKNFDVPVTSVCFDDCLRDRFYVSDCRGQVHICSMENDTLITLPLLRQPIHSLCFLQGQLFAASIFEIFKVGTGHTENLSCKIPIPEGCICTNLHSHKNSLVGTFRGEHNVVSLLLLTDVEMITFPSIKQNLRHADKVHNGYVYVVDDPSNSINVICIKTMKKTHVYNFVDPIVNFTVSDRFLVILTKKSTYWYSNKKT